VALASAQGDAKLTEGRRATDAVGCWALTPSGMRGVLNDAVSIYFLDATFASAFVARWCAGYKIETAKGVFRVRTDEPTARTTASMHRTP
jgi:hypothetical protein